MRSRDIFGARSSVPGEEYRGVGIRLPQAKTGPGQFCDVRHPLCQELLVWWSKCHVAREFLFLSRGAFRKEFDAALVGIGIGARAGFVPHSLRHGGATRDFLRLGNTSLEAIIVRGRWADIRSARRYLQKGPALLIAAAHRIPKAILESCKVQTSEIRESMHL